MSWVARKWWRPIWARRRMLELERIRVSYGAALAIVDVSLAIGARELVCVVGPNGAGKTTLINAIAGLHRPEAGAMRLDGRDLRRLAPHRYCDAGIAIVPEGRRLFTAMSVRENLELGAYHRGARARRARSLERVCALFPVLAERLQARAGALSGGQQQMLAIGRALMAEPTLLLLDEPSLGLAPLIVSALFETIRTIAASGVTMLLVEQNVALALEVASRAYVLEEGRIAAEGAPAPGDPAGVSRIDRGEPMNQRRQFMSAAAALGTIPLLPGCSAIRQPQATSQTGERRAIDTHHHFYAPEYQKAWLDWEDKRSIPHFPSQVSWSRQRALEAMDQAGVRTAILSLASTPGVWFDLPAAEVNRMARVCNDYGTDMVRSHPGRLGLYATLPMN